MMFRSLLLSAVILAGSATVSLADPDVGCGWGTQMWNGSKGTPAKVLAATTNGLFGNQTFGISSGTAGCNVGGTVTAQARTSMFAAANIDQLQRDMALGHGESLSTLAHLMSIEDADKAAFYSMTKEHFGDIFPTDSITAGQMLTTIGQLMATDTTLSRYATL
jgi:hypothetical protein